MISEAYLKLFQSEFDFEGVFSTRLLRDAAHFSEEKSFEDLFYQYYLELRPKSNGNINSSLLELELRNNVDEPKTFTGELLIPWFLNYKSREDYKYNPALYFSVLEALVAYGVPGVNLQKESDFLLKSKDISLSDKFRIETSSFFQGLL